MRLNTMHRYKWVCQLYSKTDDPLGEEVLTYEREATMLVRSDGTPAPKVLAPEAIPYGWVLAGITAPDGSQPFVSETYTGGQRWQVTHQEAIFNGFGQLDYYYHHVRRID